MNNKRLFPVFVFLLLTSSIPLFSQNKTVDGYKGIWFSYGQPLEYGFKFSGGVATYTARHRPIAIYSPEVKKTFFVYGGTTASDEQHLLIMASYYDHRSHLVPKPVIVYDKMGVSEPNDNSSLSVDGEGYLWIFVSGRGRTRPGLIFKSRQPWSIESFDKIMECEMISPQPWWMGKSGFLLMFSKLTKGRELYFSTSPDGKTWSDGRKIAGMGGHYQVSSVYGNNLVTVFNYHPGDSIDKRSNLYLLQTEDMGNTWKTVDNEIVEIPLVDKDNNALIRDFESEGRLVYISDLNFDSNGSPVILAVLSKDFRPGPDNGPKEWIIISRKGQKWNFSKVCESDHNYDKGSLYITDDGWRIIGPTEPGAQKYVTGGEITVWTSNDEGATWHKTGNITENSLNNNSFVRRPQNAQKGFFALWADGDADKLSASHLYFTNAKFDRVWVFPYEMKGNFEKPRRIR